MATRILKILLFVALALTSLSCHKYIRVNPDLPIDKFLHVNKHLHVTTCVGVPGRAKSDGGCEKKEMHRSVASAFIVKTIDIGAYVVTAAHVCEESEERAALKAAKARSPHNPKGLAPSGVISPEWWLHKKVKMAQTMPTGIGKPL